jgi:hypothetical protein
MKTLLVTLEIDVEDLPVAMRKEMASELPSDEALPGLEDHEASEIADVLRGMTPETTAELFGGSEIYAQFSDSRVVDAKWKDADSH